MLEPMADSRHDRTPIEGIGNRVEEKGGAISARKTQSCVH